MVEDVYRQLARKLNSFPTGFPAAPSGAEIRLLAGIFAPEEAALAAVLNLEPEPPGAIAARAGLSVEAARCMLEAMAQRGLIRAVKGRGGTCFALAPFIGAVYEQQLPRMDAELARLFERYYQETRGGSMVNDTPPIHRVIPVGEAIPIGVEVLPYEQASALLAEAKSWAVRDCICRVQQRLLGKGCSHPIEVCLLFAPVEGAFAGSEIDRPVTQEEALAILRAAEEAGLVHSTYNYREGIHHICNCCTCACMFLRGVAEFGRYSSVAQADFRSAVDAERCAGCGDCTRRCQFGTLRVIEGVCVVDPSRCLGCGLCKMVCPTGALRLERRPAGEGSVPPVDREEWAQQRTRRQEM